MRGTQKILCAMLATATSTVLLVIASTTKAVNAAALRGLI
jgi:hypothetical protein